MATGKGKGTSLIRIAVILFVMGVVGELAAIGLRWQAERRAHQRRVKAAHDLKVIGQQLLLYSQDLEPRFDAGRNNLDPPPRPMSPPSSKFESSENAKIIHVGNAAFFAPPTAASGADVEFGYVILDKRVILLKHGTPVRDLPPPTSKDREYVKQLSAKTRKTVLTFIGIKPELLQFEAARSFGKYLLLDISHKGVDDGNIHLFYDSEKQKVIGHFRWYLQG